MWYQTNLDWLLPFKVILLVGLISIERYFHLTHTITLLKFFNKGNLRKLIEFIFVGITESLNFTYDKIN
ncbi:hypothetical protein D3P07_04340 [Paenibacillus sp. 1011MAR3C5]|nr:hypothetical protein D3P07_04340 [Paenibacillus sp. 1011MAR3C5]